MRPKRKKRLPYHARRQLNKLPVMGVSTTCFHALAKHEDILATSSSRYYTTISYALPCISKHSSPTVPHRDSTGRKW